MAETYEYNKNRSIIISSTGGDELYSVEIIKVGRALTLFMSKSGCESKSGHPPNPGTWHDTIANDVHTNSKTSFALNCMLRLISDGRTEIRMQTLLEVYVSGTVYKTSVMLVCVLAVFLYTRRRLRALVRKVRCVN